MRVLHISLRDIAGGAARAAYRLHRGLRAANVDSRMLVAERSSDDPFVDAMQLSNRPTARLRRRWRWEAIKRERQNIARSRSPTSEIYSGTRSVFVDSWSEVLRQADVVNLHFVAGFVDPPAFFSALSPNMPVVWTLHDMNPFTGGCHYGGECRRFTTACGACPQLQSERDDDLSRREVAIKKNAYAHLGEATTAIVTPSRWLAAQARQSSLLARFRVEPVANGLDLEMFRPRGNGLRAAIGLTASDKVVLFVGDGHRKGLDLLLRAVLRMNRKDVVLASVGGATQAPIAGVRQLQLGYVQSDELLAAIYSMTDVFVIPSREDNLPQTAVEAVACGCPVVGFAIGGVPDIVVHGRNGYLAKPFDVDELAGYLERAMDERLQLSSASRSHAERCFGVETQVSTYKSLYAELIASAVSAGQNICGPAHNAQLAVR